MIVATQRITAGTMTNALPNRDARASDPIQPGDGAVRRRLLDVAERCFAEQGYRSISLRQITSEAGVNLASVNYYFGSKLGLLKAVFRRRTEPINAERFRRLRACLDASPGDDPDIERVLRAFIEPALIDIEGDAGQTAYRRLAGRIATNPIPEVREILGENFREVAEHFIEILRGVSPEMSDTEFFWRLSCVYGAMLYISADTGWMGELSGGSFDMSDTNAALTHAIPFLAAGLQLRPSSGGGDQGDE